MIAVVDYGMGNLRSVEKALQAVGAKVKVTQNVQEIDQAEKVVFPGVGAMGDCIRNLKTFGLYDAVSAAAKSGKPFLGICLGLQALFEESDESGKVSGLGILAGKVVHFKNGLKVPHMGWNQISFSNKKEKCPLLQGVEDGSYVYFVHSYYGVPKEKDVVLAQTEYGVQFASMIWKENLFATQFHPEKSQEVGLKILKNFKNL